MFSLTVVATIALTAVAGDPARISLQPAPAAAAKLVCSSINYGYNYCPVSQRTRVALVQQLSNAPCVQGKTWGTDSNGIWVNRGCAATFSSGGNGGSVVGAAIVGGIVGAILGGAANNNGYYSHNTNYYSELPYGEPSWIARQRVRDAQDEADNQRQRGDYLANQNNQLAIQASQDRQNANNARRDAQDARDNADQRAAYAANQERQRQQIIDGQEDENRQARDAQAAADRDAGEADENRQAREAEASANREAGEAEENRQAREAEKSANSDSDDSSSSDSSAEETPSTRQQQ